MDPFDKLAQDIINAKSPFELSHVWPDVQAGIAALAASRKDTEARLKKLEAAAAPKA